MEEHHQVKGCSSFIKKKTVCKRILR